MNIAAGIILFSSLTLVRRQLSRVVTTVSNMFIEIYLNFLSYKLLQVMGIEPIRYDIMVA